MGPILGGFLGKYYGLESAFYAQAVMGLAASAMMFIVVRTSSGSEDLGGHGIGGGLIATVVKRRGIFLSAGFGLIAIQLLRNGRQVFLPLWTVGAASGRAYRVCSRWHSGSFFLPATSEVYGFALVAILMGIGNGLGAGLVMTLGADFAPVDRRGEFLGVWRFIGDLGVAGGPFVVSVIVGVASLGLASILSAGLGFAGAAVMWLLVPETLHQWRPRVLDSERVGVASVSGESRGSANPPPARPR